MPVIKKSLLKKKKKKKKKKETAILNDGNVIDNENMWQNSRAK